MSQGKMILVRMVLILLVSIYLFGCGEVRRHRIISNQQGYRDVTQTVEKVLWNAEQAANFQIN